MERSLESALLAQSLANRSHNKDRINSDQLLGLFKEGLYPVPVYGIKLKTQSRNLELIMLRLSSVLESALDYRSSN